MTFKSLLLAFVVTIACVCHAQEQKSIGELRTQGAILTTAFCSNSAGIVAVAKDGYLYSWSVPSFALLNRTALQDKAVNSLACSQKLIALGMKNGKVAVLDRSTGASVQVLQSSDRPIETIAIAPDSSILAASATDEPARLWDLGSSRQIATLGTEFSGAWALAFSPDSHRLASADGDTLVRIYDRSGKLIASNSDLRLISFAATFLNEKDLAVAGADGAVTVLDANSGKAVRSTKAGSDVIFALAAGPGGKSFCALYFDNFQLRPTRMQVWDSSATRALASMNAAELVGGGLASDRFLLLKAEGERGASIIQIGN
jgi:WD40 repeat protein